jgi:RNA polymerase sigma-B factor
VRVPRPLQERYLKLEAAIVELEPQLGRSPTPSELAEHLGISPEEVIEAQEVATRREAESLDKMTPAQDGEHRVAQVGHEDASYEFIEDCVTIAPLLAALPNREREILRLRFGDDLSQREIGRRMGLSQMHVSRLIRRSLDELSAAA